MSQSVTEKRTVIQSSSGYGNEDALKYKSSVGPRPASSVKMRSSFTPSYYGGRPSSGFSYSASYSRGLQATPLPLDGSYATISNSNVSSMKTSRTKEKKDMQDLNERLATYIEKVRFLEAQNKKLVAELDDLKSKWGKETAAIKAMYETELKEVREVLDDTAKEKARFEIESQNHQEQSQDLFRQLDEAKRYRQIDRDQINKLNQQLSEYDGEISMLRRTLENMEKERERDKATIMRLTADVEKFRMELASETLAHLDAENRLQTLAEEMEFMKSLHEEEMKELANLAYRDTTEENREFWKNELSGAIREIQAEYDAKCDQIRGDMEGYYNLKVQEIRTGITKQNMEAQHSKEETRKWRTQVTDLKAKLADVEARNAQLERTLRELQRELEEKDQDAARREASLREEITQLRLELEKILQELQTLMDAKLSLELEIAAYRKLLEGEESRVGLKNVVESMITTRSSGGQSLSEVIGGSGYGAESGGLNKDIPKPVALKENAEKPAASIPNDANEILASEAKTVATEAKTGANEAKTPATQPSDAKASGPKEAKRTSKNLEQIKGDSQMSMKMMRGEVSAKTTYQRTSKGAVSIAEASPEGKYILLENNSTGSNRRDENLDGWRIVRNIDGKKDVYYNFPKGSMLRSGRHFKIFARNYASQAKMDDYVHNDDDTWGTGSQVVTKLLNPMGEEKATHTQKTLYH